MREDLIDEMYQLEASHWWHVAKRRLVLKLLNKFLKKQKQIKLIDVGCGTGMMMHDFSAYGQVFGVDNSLKALSFCQKRKYFNIIAADLVINLPIKESCFDVVTMLDVLEHIENDSLILNEINRILKKDGRFVLTVPAYPSFWTYWDEILGHKRRYRRSLLVMKLEESGFEILKSSYFYSYLLPLAIGFRVIKSILRRNFKERSDFIAVPNWFNQILLLLSSLESLVIKYFRIPIGLSIICLCKKK